MTGDKKKGGHEETYQVCASVALDPQKAFLPPNSETAKKNNFNKNKKKFRETKKFRRDFNNDSRIFFLFFIF